MPRIDPLLCLLALACQPFQPTLLPYAPAAGREPIPAFYAGALADAGFPPLASSSLPPGYRELRLSTGHGMILGPAYSVLRIVQTPNRITGEVWWVSCSPCRAQAAPRSRGVDWVTLVHRIDSLELPFLELPPSTVTISDAGDLIVEVLIASSYRGYVVNAPLRRPDPRFRPAQVASRLIDSVAGLASLH